METPLPLVPEPTPMVTTPAAPGAGSETVQWRLKKGEDGTVFGPIDEATVKAWANSAQVAPIDEIDTGDGNWVSAPSVPSLNMVWQVRLSDTETYGPTTAGAIKEFLQDGIIKETTLVTHAISKQPIAVGVLLAHPDMVAPPLPAGAAREISNPNQVVDTRLTDTGRLDGVDLAKDQRIRQLEEDLRILKKEHDDLLQKFRQLNQELISVRNRA